jgi:hypothetical protein
MDTSPSTNNKNLDDTNPSSSSDVSLDCYTIFYKNFILSKKNFFIFLF